jgi:retron-type reverse transcriptase
VLEPIFEADFRDCSYGSRPKRTAHQAIDVIAEGMHQGYTQVIDADVSKYFDTIPHANPTSATGREKCLFLGCRNTQPIDYQRGHFEKVL